MVPSGPIWYLLGRFGTKKDKGWHLSCGYSRHNECSLFSGIAPTRITPQVPPIIDMAPPGVIPMGAIPPGVATQSAAGTPSTADYYGKKNIYIYAYEYNSLCVDIRMGGSRGETITWVALSISRVTFCWRGNLPIRVSIPGCHTYGSPTS